MKAFVSIVAAGLIALGVACAKDSAETRTAKDEPAAAAKAAAQEGAARMATAHAEDPADGTGHSCAGDGTCCGGQMQPAPAGAPVPADAVWTTMKVKGMKCGGCANRIKTSLAGMEGIIDVTADHTTGEVKIAAAPGTQDVAARVRPHLDALGYKVLDI